MKIDKSQRSTKTITPTVQKLVETADSARQARTGIDAYLRTTVGIPSAAPSAKGALPPSSELVQLAHGRGLEVERSLGQTIRALRREGGGRNSKAAKRVLSHDVLRLAIEGAAWRRVETLATTAAQGSSQANVRGSAEPTALAALFFALQSNSNDRYAILLNHGLSDDPVQTKGSAKDVLNESELRAVVDVLASTDPARSGLIRERLADGASLSELKSALRERMAPMGDHAAEDDGKKEALNGMVFDLGTNTWVQKERSWAYPIPMGQLFEYQVDGIIHGEEEFAARLVAAALDPVSGELAKELSQEGIEAFVSDLADLARAGSDVAADLTDQTFELCFSTKDGGSKPVGAEWEISTGTLADVFAALSNSERREAIEQAATEARTQTSDVQAKMLNRLGPLLQRYDGVPRRHKRAHAALINLGLANQSVQQMSKPDGVLPREKTLLTPERLTSEFADSDKVKMRFLFTDAFECFVISDETFNEVVDKYHFPPNHELLSYNRPIAGSGYLTIEQGRIVALEDDTIMLPGKMPDNLPPAFEVLSTLGFSLDKEKIEESYRVLNWEAFSEVKTDDLPEAPTGSPSEVRQQILGASHGERPALVFAALKAHLQSARTGARDESSALAQTADYASEILEGFQIINVAAKDFRTGALPTDMTEFDDLHIDKTLSPFLVRRISA